MIVDRLYSGILGSYKRKRPHCRKHTAQLVLDFLIDPLEQLLNTFDTQ